MKFMVMCSLDTVGHPAPDPRVVEGLARLGLLPVTSSPTAEDSGAGIGDGFVGEFRSHEAQVLESILRGQISELLGGLGSGIVFRLCLVPTSQNLLPIRKRA